MLDRDKVIERLEYCAETRDVYVRDCINDAIKLLKEQEDALEQMRLDNTDLRNCNAELMKEQEQIKSPDEFKSLLLGMFDSIWDVEIDHPIFQDTVGELMEGVLQAYRQAVKWE